MAAKGLATGRRRPARLWRGQQTPSHHQVWVVMTGEEREDVEPTGAYFARRGRATKPRPRGDVPPSLHSGQAQSGLRRRHPCWPEASCATAVKAGIAMRERALD